MSILPLPFLAALGLAQSLSPPAEIVEVTRIWNHAPHNAFTDLIRHRDEWFCVFREGASHVSPEGALRVIRSRDAKEWTSAALITSPTADLRDAKISATPDGRLMLSGAAALHQPAAHRHVSMSWFSNDGSSWDEGHPIGQPNDWIWRVTWHEKTAYGIGYSTAPEHDIRLYTSPDGVTFSVHADRLVAEGYPNETALLFQPDGLCLCLLRRDGDPGTGLLGRSTAPYTTWTWADLGTRIGGPALIRIPDGRLVAAVRLYEPAARTSLCWLDPQTNRLEEFLPLPSGGDTSYPGLVWHDGLLWVSYYSSHEDKTSIYLAKIKFSATGPTNPP